MLGWLQRTELENIDLWFCVEHILKNSDGIGEHEPCCYISKSEWKKIETENNT